MLAYCSGLTRMESFGFRMKPNAYVATLWGDIIPIFMSARLAIFRIAIDLKWPALSTYFMLKAL